MIPYIVAPEKRIEMPWGPLTLQVFGAIVVVGVLIGIRFGLRYAKEKDLDEFMAKDQIFWSLVFAFIISHWVSVLFYFPNQVVDDPWVLLKITDGLSSVGGFFGAFVGMNWFLRRNRQPVLVYADMNIFSLVIGMVFGRIACALVHDHPGKIVTADTFLAVGPWPCRCPGGGRSLPTCCSETQQVFRYDLGLMEALFLIALAIVVYLVFDWRKAKPGRLVGLVSFCYGAARFVLDFYREYETGRGVGVTDLRYFGMTTAQYFAIAIFLAGVWLLFVRKPRPEDQNWALDSDRIAREQAQSQSQSSAEAEGADDPPRSDASDEKADAAGDGDADDEKT